MTRTRTVRLVPDLGTATGLAANQSVTLQIPSARARTSLSVHKDALLHRKGATVVFVVVDGVAEMRPIVLGHSVGSRFEVLEGLQRGEEVVVRGNERLRPGEPVRTADGAGG